jgi:hypothetical protein
VFLTVMALFAPNGTTTWLDAWAGAMIAGVIAGLAAVWWNRAPTARRQPGRIWAFITDLAALGAAAGFLGWVFRRR